MNDGVREGKKLIFLNRAELLNNFAILFVFFCSVTVFLYLLPGTYRGTGAFYIIFIASSVGSMWLSQYAKISFIKKLWFILSFSIVFFVLAFRKSSGLDDSVYLWYFNQADGASLSAFLAMSDMEIGYKLLNFFVHWVTGGNYYVFQVLCSFIPLFFFYKSFWRYREFLHLPFALFLLICIYYFQMLSTALVRMFIALGFVFWALQYIWQKRPIHYLCFVILASVFHISALMMLSFSIFASKRTSIKKLCSGFTAFAIFALPVFFIVISKIIVPMLGMRYSGYTEISGLSVDPGDFDILPFIFLGIYLKRYIPKKHVLRYRLLLTLLTLSTILSFYGSMVSFGRLVFYTNMGMLFVIPMAYFFTPQYKPLNKLAFACAIVLYGLLYVARTQFFLESHIENLFPYQNIFFTL